MAKWWCFRPENKSPPQRPASPPAVPRPNPRPVVVDHQGGDRPVQGLGEVLVDGVNRGVVLVQGQVNRGVALVQGLVQGAAVEKKKKNKKKNGFIDSGEQASLDALRGPGLVEWMVGGAKKGVGLVQGLMGYEDEAAKKMKIHELNCRRNDHPGWGDKRYIPPPQN